MNKKLIAVIVAVVVIIGVVGFIFLNNNQSNSSNTTSTNNNNSASANENNESTDDTDTNVETKGDGKVLVLYFSQSGNTETVANFIHDKVGGDIIKLETVKEYPSDYDELVDYAQDEQRDNRRPELKTKIDNIDQYDTIFLGYPNWWGDMPMPIYTFLDDYDLSGKTIAPFITHGGSGLSGTPDNIQDEEANATVTEGLAVSGSSASSSESTVNEWLSKLGY